jgi:hypothetical protein
MTVNNEEKDLLAGALVDEPPLRVELGQIVARGRRRRLIGRTGAAAGAVLGIASIAAVSVVVAGVRVGGQVASAGSVASAGTAATSVADAPALSTTAAAPTGKLSKIPVPGPGSGCHGHWSPGSPVDGVVAPTPGDPRAQAINNTLTQAWDHADLGLPAGVSLSLGAHGYPMCAGYGGWSLSEDVVTAHGNRILMVDIWPSATRQKLDCTGAQSHQPLPGCTITRLSDGTELRTMPEEGGTTGNIVLREANAIRPDGTTVSVLETSGHAPGFLPQPVLPVSVLTHIATLPGLAAHW